MSKSLIDPISGNILGNSYGLSQNNSKDGMVPFSPFRNQCRSNIFSSDSQSNLRRRHSLEKIDIIGGGRVKKFVDSSDEEKEEKEKENGPKNFNISRKNSTKIW